MKPNSVYRILLLLVYYCQYCQAGPVIRSSRMVREIYPEIEQDIPDSRMNQSPQVCIVGDVVYATGEIVPSEQPCLKCSCTPPDVRCETEICVPQPGCKAIHRPNKCCPDYQCECEHEGKKYANGERLPMAPGGECSVCYCRGGEAQCAEVGCYTRSDCKPKYITGQCCPKYDHCPPRDPLSDRIQITTTESDQLSTLTTFEPPTFNTTKSESIEEGSGELLSLQSSSDEILIITSPRPQTFIIDETKSRPATPVTFSIKEIVLKTNNNKRTDLPVMKIDKEVQTDSKGRPQITIQEVIPPPSEFKPPVIKPIHKEVVSISPVNPVTYKLDALMSTTEQTIVPTYSNDVTDNDNESVASEKSEVYEHPPPVLKIGDQLLFVKQGQLVPEKDASTPTPIITLIGAEGLQIGLGSGEVEHEIVRNEETTVKLNTIEENETTSEENIFISTTVSSSISSISTNQEEATTIKQQTSSTSLEYIPEENPYYPAIPEDIMNAGPEDLTTEGTGSSKFSTTQTPDELLSVIPLQTTTSSNKDTKILPEVLQIISNSSQIPNLAKNKTGPSVEWLKHKNEPTKVSIPLINENASLPDSILTMTAASDLISNEDIEDDVTSITSTTTSNIKSVVTDHPKKSSNIMIVEAQQSKETIEVNEDTFDSGELTTNPNNKHSSLMSNEDASVETLVQNSSPEENLDVEVIPGFEQSTQKTIEQKIIEDHDDSSPKKQVEIISIHTDKIVNEGTSHSELKNNDFHDEIRKRDVVKKVLKDVFDNPKENIRTEVLPDSDPDTVTDYPDYSLQSNEELNNVKPNDNLLLASSKNTASNTTKIILHKTQVVQDKGTTIATTISQENVQKVNAEGKTSDALSATTLSVLRDFFKTQFKQYHNSKITD